MADLIILLLIPFLVLAAIGFLFGGRSCISSIFRGVLVVIVVAIVAIIALQMKGMIDVNLKALF